MRVIGARLGGGAMVWADAGNLAVELLDEVVIRTPLEDLECTVVITPEQLLQPPGAVDGAVIEVRPHVVADPACAELPGAEMPVQGATVQTHEGRGTITGLDAVRGMVTVTLLDGTRVELKASELQTVREGR